MQCTNYLPGYYHPKDLNGCLTGNSWPIPHNDITWNGARGFHLPLPPSIGDQNPEVVHQKEMLKQTILKHEAIFRYQVNELHRVYRRQRELMDEVKRRKLVEDHLHLQALESKYFVSQLRPETQKTNWPLIDLTSTEPPTLRREMFKGSSYSIAGQIVQPGADLFPEHNVSSSSAPRKRILDLELPADEYMDSEDGKQFEEESPVQGPAVLNSELQPQYHSKVNSVNPGDSSISSSSHRGTFLLFDLNEPIQPDETECPISALESVNFRVEISNRDQDLAGTVHAECSTLKKEVTGRDESNLNSYDEVSSIERTILPCDKTASSPPRLADTSHDGTKTDSSLVVSPRRKFKEIPFAVQALPCFINTPPSKRSKSSVVISSLACKKIDPYSSSSASSPTSGVSGSCLMKYGGNDHTSGRADAVKFSKFSESMNLVKDMDLNCTPSDLSDNQLSTPTSNCERSVVLDCILSPDSALESRKSTSDDPFVGPGNDSKLLTTDTINLFSINKRTLSSGHSEATMATGEKDLEAPVSPENKESSPPRGDSEDTAINHTSDHTGEPDRAAAEALLFISSSAVQGQSKTAIDELSEASHDSLGLLANIATSLASNPQNKIGKETESVFNTLHSWPRRSRRRSVNYQKVLQTKVRPAAASVSLHQLNEDLLATGGLKSDATKTLRKASLRSRRHSLLQPHSGNDKQHISERFCKGWGVTKGRQNGRRARACFSPFFSC